MLLFLSINVMEYQETEDTTLTEEDIESLHEAEKDLKAGRTKRLN